MSLKMGIRLIDIDSLNLWGLIMEPSLYFTRKLRNKIFNIDIRKITINHSKEFTSLWSYIHSKKKNITGLKLNYNLLKKVKINYLEKD